MLANAYESDSLTIRSVAIVCKASFEFAICGLGSGVILLFPFAAISTGGFEGVGTAELIAAWVAVSLAFLNQEYCFSTDI